MPMPLGLRRSAPPPAADDDRRRPWLLRGVVVALVVTAGAVVALLIRHELRQRALRQAALVWDEFHHQADRQDVAGLRRSLERLHELVPDDPRPGRWEAALASGHADPADLGMVRLLMN